MTIKKPGIIQRIRHIFAPSEKNIWVTKGEDGWQTRREKDEVLATYPTQKEAWEAAKDAARADRVTAVLHSAEGKIREEIAYQQA